VDDRLREKDARLAENIAESTKPSADDVVQTQVSPSVLCETDTQAGSAVADREAKEPQALTESTVQQISALSTSQRLWNDAYDSLEHDNDTAKLVKAYVKTLTKVLEANTAPSISTSEPSDVSIELKDSTKRQMYMKKLVEEGRTKVFTTSKITKGVDDVAQFILSAKRMIDLTIQNIPQAALSWADVCVELQVSTHSSCFSCLISVLTDTRPDPLESCERDKIQPCRHHSCRFENELILRPDRTSPE